MARVEEFVRGEFPIAADPQHVSTKAFKRYGVYLIDKKGVIRVFFEGTKTARPRLDMVINELAAIEGVPAPAMSYVDGKISTAGGAEEKKHKRRMPWKRTFPRKIQF